MKKNYISDIRYCEKIKQSQSFKSVDGLQKKVRKRIKISPNIEIDAEKQLRQIMCFWKEGWDYDHYHPVFLNPKVYYPIVTMSDPQSEQNPELKKYAEVMKKLIERLRIDQQIQVNYKIEERKYISQWQRNDEIDKKWKYFKVADISNKHLFRRLETATKGMVHSVSESLKDIQNHFMEFLENQDIAKAEEIKKQLLFLNKIFDRHAEDSISQMMEEEGQKTQSHMQNLNVFVANVVSILDQMKDQTKESTHGPSLIAVQPKIGELTYVLHPILWSIYSFFCKEQYAINKLKNFMRQFEEQSQNTEGDIITSKQLDERQQLKMKKQAEIWKSITPRKENYLLEIKDNYKRENQAYSRVVFLNFDGYESEFNLQVARNFNKNLMYVSFPKFSVNSEKQVSAFEERFYNKIMFEKTRMSEEFSDNEELQHIAKKQRIISSPQEYHEHIQKLYKQNNSNENLQKNTKGQIDNTQFLKFIDRNEKIYIFPIRMNCLVQKHKQQFPETNLSGNQKSYRSEIQAMGKEAAHEAQKLCDLAETYESYFIRFLMRKYMYNQIQKFRPTHIIISYSNRITIEDSHFVEMMQQLTNLGRYKLMLFPNFTTSLIDEIKEETKQVDKEQEEQQKSEEQIELSNCYSVSNARLVISHSNSYMDSMASKGYDNCPLTLSFFAKIMRFLKISSGTYNLKQNYQYEPFALKLKNIKIYPYAQFLFDILSDEYSHLSNKIDKEMLKADKYFLEDRLREEKEELKKCVPKFYRSLFEVLEMLVVHGIYGQMPIEQTNSEFQGPPPSPYTIDVRRIFETWTNMSDRQGIKRVRNHHIQSISQPFKEFITSEEKEKMDSKYEVNSHLYFKIYSEGFEFNRATQGTLNLKSNNTGLRIVTFKLDKENILPIFKDTSLVFQTNQIGKSKAFVLVMNHLGVRDEEVKHYIGMVNLEKKPSFAHEVCMVQQIQFFDGNQPIQSDQYKAKCEWNFKQTDHYLILYWPSEYDFVKASLLKMIKQQYEPRICHDIYIAKKTKPNKFYKARINLDISAVSVLPRRGCTAYELDNKLFIFGGVYERQFNYLNVQNDIVSIDLNTLAPAMKPECQTQFVEKMSQISIQQKQHVAQNVSLQDCNVTIKNIKQKIYSQEYVESIVSDVEHTRKLNSFVRPKIEIEFFESNDICSTDFQPSLNQGNIHTVIMVGGYGENFMFPHSLLTYFYHIINFDKATRQIISIEKRNTIQKPIPINLKELVKNKNIFQHFWIFQNDTISQGLTRENHYFYHRAVYQLSKPNKKTEPNSSSGDIYDLNYKFIFLYATELYNQMDKNYLRFAQKIGEKRVIEESEGTKVQIVNGCNNNLFITNEDGTFLYSLNYKIQLGSMQIIPLINEAIISLDVSNNIACALIKHKEHTKDKCVLASEKIELPNPKFAFQNKNHYVNLIKFIEFEENYELHMLFMMKRNEMIIAHGVSFSEYDVKDQVITTKYTKAEGLGEISEERSPQVNTPHVSSQQFYQITSFLARQNQKIFTISFMSHQSKQQDFIYCFQKYSLDMNSQTKKWNSQTERKYISFYYMDGNNEIYLRKIQFIQARQNNASRLNNSSCVIVPSTPLALSQNQFSFSIQRIESEPSFNFNGKKIHKVKVYQVSEKEPWSRISWKRIYKNQQRYQDCCLKLKIINKMENA